MTKACDDAGVIRNVPPGQFFVTTHDIQLAGFGCASSCRESTFPRDDRRSKLIGLVRRNTRIEPVLEVKGTNHLERNGVEIKIDSMQKDGTQSWIVISRSVNKHVTELPEEDKNPVHCEEAPSSTGQLVAMKQEETA